MADALLAPRPPPADVLTLTPAEICDYLATTFDAKYYADRYPDMALGHVDPIEHYTIFGWKEGRDPCDWFSTKRYLRHHVDVAQKDINPLLHYVLYGQQEGRRVWPADCNGSLDLDVDAAASFVTDDNLRELTLFPPRPLCPPRTRLRADRLLIHWLLPDFSAGGGGHMTIFRIVRWLEIMGHECTLWITSPAQHRNSNDAYDDIIKSFQTIRARVAFADEGFDAASGDIVVATGWQTVARVLNAIHFRQRCYFVQDYEASFHPMGSNALVAAWTYSQDLGCLCAGPWLTRRLRQQFGRWTRQFNLAFDPDIYHPAEPCGEKPQRNRRSRPHIALYARHGTARRAVELAFLALERLAASGVKFHLDLFGEDNTFTRSPFPCTSHGVLGAPELADLYRSADVGICFSATNYSLVPQEMMACGLPVVEIDGDSTRAVFPPGVVTLAGPHPLAIAAEIAALLKDLPRRTKQAAMAHRWVSRFHWEKSAKAVEQALLERLGLRNSQPARNSHRTIRRHRRPKATVCIPAYNGGELLLRVVERLRSQRTPWQFEIVIVDSSSTDGSIRSLMSTPVTDKLPLRITTIPQCEFQHGRTRNLCGRIATGEFLAFLTQDAMPTDEFWLYNLVTVLERFPRAAGAFGRHLAWPGASAFTKREIDEHFASLARYPLVLSRDTNPSLSRSGDKEWQQVLHYFSDNNSCLRRSVWEQVPYPELDYGEDQAWAHRIIQLGYEKVYVPSATVYHSHEYTVVEATARAATEAAFFATAFGYQAYECHRSFDEQLEPMQHADMRWARANRISQADLAHQLALNKAKLSGRMLGMERARTQGAGELQP